MVPRLFEWTDWKEVIIPLLGKTPSVDPYALEFGEPISERINRMSPKFKRDQLRLRADVVAQHMQDMYLGAIYPDIMTPEDVASVAGTGSLFVEDDIQKVLSTSGDLDFQRVLSNEKAMWFNRMRSYVPGMYSQDNTLDDEPVHQEIPVPTQGQEMKSESEQTVTSSHFLNMSPNLDLRRNYRAWRSKPPSPSSKSISK